MSVNTATVTIFGSVRDWVIRVIYWVIPVSARSSFIMPQRQKFRSVHVKDNIAFYEFLSSSLLKVPGHTACE